MNEERTGLRLHQTEFSPQKKQLTIIQDSCIYMHLL